MTKNACTLSDEQLYIQFVKEYIGKPITDILSTQFQDVGKAITWEAWSRDAECIKVRMGNWLMAMGDHPLLSMRTCRYWMPMSRQGESNIKMSASIYWEDLDLWLSVKPTTYILSYGFGNRPVTRIPLVHDAAAECQRRYYDPYKIHDSLTDIITA